MASIPMCLYRLSIRTKQVAKLAGSILLEFPSLFFPTSACYLKPGLETPKDSEVGDPSLSN